MVHPALDNNSKRYICAVHMLLFFFVLDFYFKFFLLFSLEYLTVKLDSSVIYFYETKGT